MDNHGVVWAEGQVVSEGGEIRSYTTCVPEAQARAQAQAQAKHRNDIINGCCIFVGIICIFILLMYFCNQKAEEMAKEEAEKKAEKERRKQREQEAWESLPPIDKARILAEREARNRKKQITLAENYLNRVEEEGSTK